MAADVWETAWCQSVWLASMHPAVSSTAHDGKKNGEELAPGSVIYRHLPHTGLWETSAILKGDCSVRFQQIRWAPRSKKQLD